MTQGVYLDIPNLGVIEHASPGSGPTYCYYATKAGPFQFSSNLYCVAVNGSTTPSPLEVLKSTDGGSTWTNMDGGSAPTSVHTFFQPYVCQVLGTVIYVMYMNSTGVSTFSGLRIAAFDTSTDTWGTVTSDLNVGSDLNSSRSPSFTFLASAPNTFIAVFEDGFSTKKLYYSSYSGSWAVPTQITDIDISLLILTGFARDLAGGVLHFFYSQYQLFGGSPLSPNVVKHRTLNSSSVLSSPDTAIANADNSFMTSGQYESYPGFGEGIVLAGGNIIMPWMQGGILSALILPSTLVWNGSVWSTHSIATTNQYSNSQNTTAKIQTALDPDGVTVHIFWNSNVTDFISGDQTAITFHVTTTDGSTFSAIDSFCQWEVSGAIVAAPPTPISWNLNNIFCDSLSAAVLSDGTQAVVFVSQPSDGNQYAFYFSAGGSVPPNTATFPTSITILGPPPPPSAPNTVMANGFWAIVNAYMDVREGSN